MDIHILSDIHTEFSELVTELKKAFDGPTVVVTHHLPATPSIADREGIHPNLQAKGSPQGWSWKCESSH